VNIYMICTLWTPFQAERDWKNSYREILLIPLYNSILYDCILYVFIDICERTSVLFFRWENLTLGQIFFKKGFMWLVRNGFIKHSCFGPCIHFTLYRSITIFKKSLYQTTYLKRGGGWTFAVAPPFQKKVGCTSPSTPPWICAWGRLISRYCSYLTCIIGMFLTPQSILQYCS